MPTYKIEEIRNAKSLNEDNSHFDVDINHPKLGWIPYTLTPDDADGTITNSELLSMIGSDYAAFVPPTSEEIITAQTAQAREERNRLLSSYVDPVVSNPLRWNELSEEKKQAWADYRKALLDITEQSGFPQNIIWPTMPDPVSSEPI